MRFLLRCKPNTKKPPTGKKVAIIGAGPAGLGAAGVLLCNGHEVDVYDALPEPGGLLIIGIPAFRVPKEGVREGVKELAEAGARFFTSTFVYCGEKPHEHEALLFVKEFVNLEDIIKKYDAVVITTGTWRSRSLEIPGEDLPGVYKALDYLARIYANQLGYLPKEKVYPTGRKVLVVGAGLTAVDAARTRPTGKSKIYPNAPRPARQVRKAKAGTCARQRVRGGVRHSPHRGWGDPNTAWQVCRHRVQPRRHHKGR